MALDKELDGDFFEKASGKKSFFEMGRGMHDAKKESEISIKTKGKTNE